MEMPDRSPFTSATNTGTPGGKTLGEALQGHRLAGAGRARDQAVAVGAAQFERLARSVRPVPEKYARLSPFLIPVPSFSR